MARPFDPGRLDFTGDAFPLAENVSLLSLTAAAAVFSASHNSVLVYQTSSGPAGSKLVWLDRDGKPQGTLGEPADFVEVALSPDGKRAAATVRDPTTGKWDLWLYDVSHNLATRFTFDPAMEKSPAWSPDGQWIAYASSRKGHDDLYRKAVAGSSEEELLVESETDKDPVVWSPDGHFLAYVENAKDTKGDILLLPMDGERKPRVFLRTQFNEYPAAFSPDGHWLVYGSDESGKFQLYVTSFPTPGRKWQVSREEGGYAYWSADGKEIVYHGFSGTIWAIEVAERSDSLDLGAPKPLFKLSVPPKGTGAEIYATSDHQRFLVLDHGQKANALLNLVVNWTAVAKR